MGAMTYISELKYWMVQPVFGVAVDASGLGESNAVVTDIIVMEILATWK